MHKLLTKGFQIYTAIKIYDIINPSSWCFGFGANCVLEGFVRKVSDKIKSASSCTFKQNLDSKAISASCWVSKIQSFVNIVTDLNPFTVFSKNTCKMRDRVWTIPLTVDFFWPI